VQADWPDGTLAEYVLLPASSVVPADGFEDMEATQLAAVSRFVIRMADWSAAGSRPAKRSS
jgi:alcohol dehydrogenase